jgi:hypothetical protein
MSAVLFRLRLPVSAVRRKEKLARKGLRYAMPNYLLARKCCRSGLRRRVE